MSTFKCFISYPPPPFVFIIPDDDEVNSIYRFVPILTHPCLFPSPSGAGGESNYHFKTLVPAVAAGAIIGKGGETIAALQKETNARVKMSKSHDFYPGKQQKGEAHPQSV